nr:MAG TPA: hypothetical protein [Caudoviricetes sp.]
MLVHFPKSIFLITRLKGRQPPFPVRKSDYTRQHLEPDGVGALRTFSR